MRPQILLGVLLATAPGVAAQSVEVRVDPRVELFAALFHLAGREEYNSSRVPRWITALDSHFMPFAAHGAARTTEWLAKQNRVGFFVPMNLAVHLTMPPNLSERSAFATTSSVHRTWTTFPDSTRAYLERVRAFAIDARFADFLRSQSTVIDSTNARFKRVVDQQVDKDWFNRFWGGPPKGVLLLVPALTNGGASYGVEYSPSSGSTEAYAIIGVTNVDALGLPTFDTSTVSTVIHEMNHPYVTPLVRDRTSEFRAFSDSLYAPVARQMRAQSYGTWDAMLNESIVRAAAIRYELAHRGRAAAESSIAVETKLGFVWTRELVDLLGEYEQDRARYPAMSEFMPRVIEFFRRRAAGARERIP